MRTRRGNAAMTSNRKKARNADVSRSIAAKDADDMLRTKEWAMLRYVERVRQTVGAASREAEDTNKGPRGDYPDSAELPSSLLNPLQSLPPFLTVDEVNTSTRGRAATQ